MDTSAGSEERLGQGKDESRRGRHSSAPSARYLAPLTSPANVAFPSLIPPTMPILYGTPGCSIGNAQRVVPRQTASISPSATLVSDSANAGQTQSVAASAQVFLARSFRSPVSLISSQARYFSSNANDYPSI